MKRNSYILSWTATASRDLRKGVEAKLFEREGDKNKTVYRIISD